MTSRPSTRRLTHGWRESDSTARAIGAGSIAIQAHNSKFDLAFSPSKIFSPQRQTNAMPASVALALKLTVDARQTQPDAP
ncbi:MAG: hypothetical protein Q4G03_01555 [Planctomycetia bacterium]|nr:hypothetical protein [Planctomycetia bacterium]